MTQAKTGDTVKINYEAKFSSGMVFDASFKDNPLEFTIGQGQVIEGLEQAVVGMELGASKTAVISPDKAFGPYIKEKIVKLHRGVVPENLELEPGKQYEGTNSEGKPYYFTVREVSDSTVIVDANHPLAGKEFIIDVRLVEIAEE